MRVHREDLESALGDVKGAEYLEARWHSKVNRRFMVSKGELETATVSENSGIAVRAFKRGAWGFSTTVSSSRRDVREAALKAMAMADAVAVRFSRSSVSLAESKLCVGEFKEKVNDPVSKHSDEEKITLVMDAERIARSSGQSIKSVSSFYGETTETRAIVNTDGASCTVTTQKPEFLVSSVAVEGVQSSFAFEGLGLMGGWKDLFKQRTPEDIAAASANRAATLLHAKQPKGEKTVVVLNSEMVGLLAHEAVGHLVEAEFVVSGSVMSSRLGSHVASELVNVSDSGQSEIVPGAAGTIFVDDEGVKAEETRIIEGGILKSYLHNRETASHFNVAPTGNARAFSYSDEPIIRMRNTFFRPGNFSEEEIVSGVKHGYLLKGGLNGQADANGEFMFGFQECQSIENGETTETLRGASVSGNLFETLLSIDAVGSKFRYAIGTGYCGKWQPAKVDGGGPYIRCVATVGGSG